MQLLKQSTAFTTVVGPILDSAGAEYTGAVIGDLSISKNGTEAAMASAATLTHVSNGHYTLVGTTGNSDTLGRLRIRCNKSTYQMPPVDFSVLQATVFDALVTNAAGGASGLPLSKANNIVDANVIAVGPTGANTAQTARDIGASVLLSSGTGTGQLDFTNGVVKSNWTQILGTTITGTAAQLAAAITKFFNVASPTGTVNSLPDAAPNAAGGLPISAAGGLNLDAKLANTNEITAARMGALTDWIDGGRLDVILDAKALSSEVTGLNVNTRANVVVPIEIETPDASTQVYKIRLFLFDVTGNMEAPDSTPTIALVNAAGTDRSSRLSVASNPSTGVYSWDYTATAGDAEEQLNWTFTVVEGALTRTYPAVSYVVEETAYRFSSADRTKLEAVHSKLPSKTYLAGSNNSDGDVQLDEATGTVTRVTLVDTTTTNTDMRGTNNAALATELAKVPKSDSNVSWNATALAAIGTAAWAHSTRTLSSYGTLVADVVTAVWVAVTRTLTSGAAPSAAAVAAQVDITLSASHGSGAWDTGGGGSGARTVTITVNDGSTVLEDANVRLIKGAENYVLDTNSSGVAVFSLDDGTWSVAISRPGYTFTPTTLVVNGTETQTYSMTLVTITPGTPTSTTAYVTIRNSAGALVSGATVQLEILAFANGSSAVGINNPRVSGTTNGSGFVQFVGLPRLATYRVRIGTSGTWYQGTTDDAETTPLAAVLGVAQ